MTQERVDRLAHLIAEAVEEASNEQGYLGIALSVQRAQMLAERVIEMLDEQGFEEQFVEYGPSTAVVFLAGAICSHGLSSVELAMELAQNVIDRDDAYVRMEG